MTRLMTLLDLAEGYPTEALRDIICVGADLAGDSAPASPQIAADLIDPSIGAAMGQTGDDLAGS